MNITLSHDKQGIQKARLFVISDKLSSHFLDRGGSVRPSKMLGFVLFRSILCQKTFCSYKHTFPISLNTKPAYDRALNSTIIGRKKTTAVFTVKN
jgi:hypothetical protein